MTLTKQCVYKSASQTHKAKINSFQVIRNIPLQPNLSKNPPKTNINVWKCYSIFCMASFDLFLSLPLLLGSLSHLSQPLAFLTPSFPFMAHSFPFMSHCVKLSRRPPGPCFPDHVSLVILLNTYQALLSTILASVIISKFTCRTVSSMQWKVMWLVCKKAGAAV